MSRTLRRCRRSWLPRRPSSRKPPSGKQVCLVEDAVHVGIGAPDPRFCVLSSRPGRSASVRVSPFDRQYEDAHSKTMLQLERRLIPCRTQGGGAAAEVGAEADR